MKDSLWSLDLFRCESATLRTHWVLVVMDQFTLPIASQAVDFAIGQIFLRTIFFGATLDLTTVEPIECIGLHLWRRAAYTSIVGSTIVDIARSRSSQANRGYLLR
jgi:hypothetical protein